MLEVEAAKRRAQADGKKRGQKSVESETTQENGRAAEQAAKAAGIGPTTVKLAKVIDDADPDLGDEVLAGKKSLGQAKRMNSGKAHDLPGAGRPGAPGRSRSSRSRGDP